MSGKRGPTWQTSRFDLFSFFISGCNHDDDDHINHFGVIFIGEMFGKRERERERERAMREKKKCKKRPRKQESSFKQESLSISSFFYDLFNDNVIIDLQQQQNSIHQLFLFWLHHHHRQNWCIKQPRPKHMYHSVYSENKNHFIQNLSLFVWLVGWLVVNSFLILEFFFGDRPIRKKNTHPLMLIHIIFEPFNSKNMNFWNPLFGCLGRYGRMFECVGGWI